MALSAAEAEAYASHQIARNRGYYLGPLLLGTEFDILLCGFVCFQLLQYSRRAASDRIFNRLVVAWVGTVAIASTIFIVAWSFHAFVYDFGEYFPLVRWDWYRYFAVMDVLCTVPVQLFYVERAYQLHNKSTLVLLTTIPLIAASMGGALGACIYVGVLNDTTMASQLSPFFYTWLASDLVVDTLLTILILVRLLRARTGWQRTDRVVTHLARISAEAQLMPTLIAIAAIVTFGIHPDHSMSIFYMFWHPKIYVIGLLAVLNSRSCLRRELRGDDSGMTPASDLRGRPAKATFSRPLHVTQEVEVYVDTDGTAVPLTVTLNRPEPMYDPSPSSTPTTRRASPAPFCDIESKSIGFDEDIPADLSRVSVNRDNLCVAENLQIREFDQSTTSNGHHVESMHHH